MSISEILLIKIYGNGFRTDKEEVLKYLFSCFRFGLIIPCAVYRVPLAVKLYCIPCVIFTSGIRYSVSGDDGAVDTKLAAKDLERLCISGADRVYNRIAVALGECAVCGLVSKGLPRSVFCIALDRLMIICDQIAEVIVDSLQSVVVRTALAGRCDRALCGADKTVHLGRRDPGYNAGRKRQNKLEVNGSDSCSGRCDVFAGQTDLLSAVQPCKLRTIINKGGISLHCCRR